MVHQGDAARQQDRVLLLRHEPAVQVAAPGTEHPALLRVGVRHQAIAVDPERDLGRLGRQVPVELRLPVHRHHGSSRGDVHAASGGRPVQPVHRVARVEQLLVRAAVDPQQHGPCPEQWQQLCHRLRLDALRRRRGVGPRRGPRVGVRPVAVLHVQRHPSRRARRVPLAVDAAAGHDRGLLRRRRRRPVRDPYQPSRCRGCDDRLWDAPVLWHVAIDEAGPRDHARPSARPPAEHDGPLHRRRRDQRGAGAQRGRRRRPDRCLRSGPDLPHRDRRSRRGGAHPATRVRHVGLIRGRRWSG